jgi:HNH endonuclease
VARRSAGYVIDNGPDGCWIWTGSRMSNGYGRVHANGARVGAHRYVFELFRGPIPRGLELDHRCHDPATCSGGPTCPHRPCVNPWHLEPVDRRRNNAPERKSGSLTGPTCRRGHDLTAPGAIIVAVEAGRTNPHRWCAACYRPAQRAAWRRYAARRKGAA